MNTYKITTDTGFTNYLGSSKKPIDFKKDMFGFDYDKFNSYKSVKPEWDNSSGVIVEIELFYCGERNEQVKEILTNN